MPSLGASLNNQEQCPLWSLTPSSVNNRAKAELKIPKSQILKEKKRISSELSQKVNQVAQSQEEQQKQASKDYKEWVNNPNEWEVDKKEEKYLKKTFLGFLVKLR